MSASSQYYAYLSTIRDIATVLGQKFCRSKGEECLHQALSLSTATYLDIDYDTISRALVINAGWPSAPGEKGWSETISGKASDATVEIGVLIHEPNPDPEDIQFGGFLAVLGQDTSPSKPSTTSAQSLFHTKLPQNQPASKHPRATTPSSPNPPPPSPNPTP